MIISFLFWKWDWMIVIFKFISIINNEVLNINSNLMRQTPSQNVKFYPQEQDQQIRDSNKLLKKLEHIKQSISPHPSSKYQIQNKERWSKYLPASEHFKSFHSREQGVEMYRKSLQNKLQKLFREQKNMLKQRHYNQSFEGKSHITQQNNFQNILDRSKGLARQSSMQKMQRKILILEQKYLKHDRSKLPPHQISFKHNKELNVQKQTEGTRYNRERTQKSKSTYLNIHIEDKNRSEDHFQNHRNNQNLETQMAEIRKQVKQLREHNIALQQQIHKKQQKKKHKRHTKELLLQILKRLQFINFQIQTSKRNGSNKKINKIEQQASNLVEEFNEIKEDYNRLEGQRKKIQQRQKSLEQKIQKIIK